MNNYIARSAWKRIVSVLLCCGAAALRLSAQPFTTLGIFNGTNGSHPFYGSLIQGIDGYFYGTTQQGGTLGGFGNGTIFRINTSGALTTLYSFDWTDGAYPNVGLIQATDGNFYGTTTYGGASGYGTVFKITPAGTLTTLHSFDVLDGAYPYGSLLQANNGNLYGTTQ